MVTGETTLVNGTAGIDNFVGGPGDDILNGNAGNDILNGVGGDDTLNGGAGDDILVGGINTDTASYANSLAGVTVNLATGTATGGDGNDTLSEIENVTGSNFGDTLTGDGSANLLNGLDGNDILFGGGGNDTFVFNTALNAATNVDTILDFNATTGDKIALEDVIFVGVTATGGTLDAASFVANSGGTATTGTQRILYDTATRNLFYDADGDGATAKVLFAKVDLAGLIGTVDRTDFTVI